MKRFITSLLFFVTIVSQGIAHDFEVDGLYFSILDAETINQTFDTSVLEDEMWVVLSASDSNTKPNEYSDTYFGMDDVLEPSYHGNVRIPKEVTFRGETFKVMAIAANAFSLCDLDTVNVPNTVQYMNFSNAKIKRLVIEDGDDDIKSSYPYDLRNQRRDNIFFYYGLTSKGCCIDNLYIGRTINLDTDTFYNSGIKNVEFGPNLWRIDNGLLAYNQLREVRIPENIKCIGCCAFAWNEQLETVVADRLDYRIDGMAFQGCKKLKNIEIKGLCESIGNQAFADCEGLQKIVLPQNIVALGDSAFANCSNLEYVELPNSLQVLGGLFVLFFVDYKNIEGNVFANCHSLKEITMKNTHPIECLYSNFENDVVKNAVLKVPTHAVEKYKKAEGWNRFINIEGIENVNDDLCSVLVLGCGTDGWSEFKCIDATIDGDTISYSSGSVYRRHRGEEIELKFSSGYAWGDYYDVDNVLVNGKDVTSAITDNTLRLKVNESLTVDVIAKIIEDTAIDSEKQDRISLSSVNGKLEIRNIPANSNLSILDVQGRTIKANCRTQNPIYNAVLPTGVYIVRIDNRTYKIAL